MKKENGTFEQWAKKGWAMVDGKLVKASTQATPVHKVKKLPDLNIKHVHGFSDGVYLTENLERGIAPEEPFTNGDKSLPPVVMDFLNNSSTGNKKVLNATKSVNDEGVKFDSNLERYLYDRLKAAKIDFQFQVEYLLQEKFRYNGEAIRAITLTVDFFLPGHNMIADTKGFANDRAPLKYKMLKWVLQQQWLTNEIGSRPTIELPATKKQCDELVNRLLYDKK